MTWLGVPWFIGGGAEHQPELVRSLLYVATGGAEGVGGVNDCKVRATPTPSGSVLVGAGTAVALNRYPGGNAQQSYMDLNPGDDTRSVGPTSGSARSDLVVARVDDRQYGGSVPASVKDGPYFRTEIIPGVPASTRKFSQLGLSYPAIELARIDIPASTANITDGMIVDLRSLAQPRKERTVYPVQFVGSYRLDSTDKIWVANPAGMPGGIWVPPWATHVTLRMDIEQGSLVNSASQFVAGSGQGTGRGRLGTFGSATAIKTAETGWRWDATVIGVRSSVGFADTKPVPASMRGTYQQIGVDAHWTAGTNTFPFIDINSYAVYDVEFSERIG